MTECPSFRSSAATPPTCSLTSWGRDQANGVTRQMRTGRLGAIGPECSARIRALDGSSPLAAAFAGLRACLRMKRSVMSRASSSRICFGGDFIRYELGPPSAPATPLFSASFASRTASITIPAEFGESQTSSFSSTFSGTSPKAVPSMRMYAHLRSVSHGT